MTNAYEPLTPNPMPNQHAHPHGEFCPCLPCVEATTGESATGPTSNLTGTEMEDFAALAAKAHDERRLTPDEQAQLDEFIRREGGPGRWGQPDPTCPCPACVEATSTTNSGSGDD